MLGSQAFHQRSRKGARQEVRHLMLLSHLISVCLAYDVIDNETEMRRGDSVCPRLYHEKAVHPQTPSVVGAYTFNHFRVLLHTIL